MRMYDIISKKRNGEVLSNEEIAFFIKGYVDGSIPDYQASALLMAIYLKGMTSEETATLTKCMAESGEMIDLSPIPGIKVDKHSTGGVGDKTTLIISSIVACCGVHVAKMSGRGLGHTGGTIDKMESIPGMQTSIPKEKFFEIVKNVGASVIGQSGNIVPADKKLYAQSFKIQHENTDPFNGKTLVEPYPKGVYVVQNVPQPPLSVQEMDDVYALPYVRTYHPVYEKDGGVPAIKEIKFSLISNRGCFGGCNFCALTFHQGRTIQVRSHESILEEARLITQEPEFKGYIHDVGGPTANFRQPSCQKQLKIGVCKHRQCLCPKPCPNLEVDHSDYLSLLRKLRDLPRVKKVFVRSGIRFDYLMLDKDDAFFRELVEHHISGQLKVAPEHICDTVLSKMGKPENAVYEAFTRKYKKLNQQLGKNQFLVPYLMSSHPGSTLKEAVALAEYLRDLGYMPEQVQDFYPTPSTMSTVMYYTGIDPTTMKSVYVCRNPHEKAMQRALIQYRNPKNYELVKEALKLAGREDLIGFDKKCLIKPRKISSETTDRKNYAKKSFDKQTQDKKSFHSTKKEHKGNVKKKKR